MEATEKDSRTEFFQRMEAPCQGWALAFFLNGTRHLRTGKIFGGKIKPQVPIYASCAKRHASGNIIHDFEIYEYLEISLGILTRYCRVCKK